MFVFLSLLALTSHQNTFVIVLLAITVLFLIAWQITRNTRQDEKLNNLVRSVIRIRGRQMKIAELEEIVRIREAESKREPDEVVIVNPDPVPVIPVIDGKEEE